MTRRRLGGGVSVSGSSGPRVRPLGGLALLIGLALAVVMSGPAVAQDPLVGSGAQDWLGRVVPSGLTPPDRLPPIAIIEDGFDREHPEMQGGWVVERRPGRRPADPSDEAAGIEHGTAVASIIGAPRDGRGMEGVLPGARVWVYGTSRLCPDVAAAVRQAVRDGARVVNVSGGFESAGACGQLRDAVAFAYGSDVLVVASAGNNRPRQRWVQPGSDWHVLTVGAVNHLDQTTSFSQQNISMDLTAPGEGVLAAVPVWADLDGVADGYSRLDGTSFSAPMVAAAAAWLMAVRPRWSADQVAYALRYSARDLGRRGWDRAYGWGMLDIAAALRARPPLHDPLEPNEDIRWVTGRAGFAPDPALLGRKRRDALRARLDVAEDPYDLYRVSVPIGRGARITVRSPSIAVDLRVFRPSARFVGQRGTLVARSTRPGLRDEQVTIVNNGARQPALVEVRARRGRSLAGTYTLTVALLR